MTRDKIDLSTYLPAVKDVIDNIYKRNGKYYALPNFYSYGKFVLYNAGMLAEAGLKPPPTDWEDRSWTWDIYLDYARKLTKNASTPDVIFGSLSYGTEGSTRPSRSTTAAT
jgi:multiple sugar transport system substrate-binding protein